MTRFDFLRDGRSPAFRMLWQSIASARLLAPALVMATGLAGLTAAWAGEIVRGRAAQSDLVRAQAQYDAYRARDASDGVRLRSLEAEIALGHRLHALRASGTIAARSVARVGNALPARVWLTSIDDADGRYAIKGGAAGLHALRDAVRNLERERRGNVERFGWSQVTFGDGSFDLNGRLGP